MHLTQDHLIALGCFALALIPLAGFVGQIVTGVRSSIPLKGKR